MPTCEGCGEHVTARFARVFGDREDTVYGCPECLDNNAIRNGAPARTDA